MIVFELACRQGHRFEGWFASGEEFARQQERRLVTCPVCDDGSVERIPSARVSVPKSGARAERSERNEGAEPAQHEPAPAKPETVVAGLPAEIVAKLREIVRNTENVGTRFPEEARKIHYQEAPARSIRGQASSIEAAELAEEGIDFAALPPFLTNDTH